MAGEVQAPQPSPLLPPLAASCSRLAATTVWFGQKTMKVSRTLASNGEAVLFPAPAAAGVYVNFHGSFLLLLTGEASVVFSPLPPPPGRRVPSCEQAALNKAMVTVSVIPSSRDLQTPAVGHSFSSDV